MSESTQTETSTAVAAQRHSIVWPTLRYRDARAAIGFLIEAFGFEDAAVHGEGDTGRPRGTALADWRRRHARLGA